MTEEKLPPTQIMQMEQAFFNDGYNLAGELVKKDSSPAVLLAAMKEFYEVLDNFIEAFLASTTSDAPSHCEKGCAWCCHQAVFAETHEFKYLKDWLFKNKTAEELQAIRASAKTKKEHTLGLAPEELLLHKEACPLLKDGACVAYEARPVACRIYLSMSKASCKNEFDNPKDKSRFPELFDLPIKLGRRLNQGFSLRLKELGHDIKESPVELGILGH